MLISIDLHVGDYYIFFTKVNQGGILRMNSGDQKYRPLSKRTVTVFIMTIIFLIIGGFFPTANGIIVIIPAFIALMTAWENIYDAILLSLTGMLLSWGLNIPYISVITIIFLSVIGIMLGFGIKKNSDSIKVIFGTTFILLILLVFYGIYFRLQNGVTLSEAVIKMYSNAILSTVKSEQLKLLKEQGINLNVLLNSMSTLFPAILFSSSLFICFVSYYTATFIMNREGQSNIYPSFSSFSLPGNQVIGIFLILIFVQVIKYMHIEYSETIASTSLVIVSFLMYLQGLAVLSFWTGRRFAPLSGKIIFLISIIFLPGMPIFLGMFDGVFNFRRTKK